MNRLNWQHWGLSGVLWPRPPETTVIDNNEMFFTEEDPGDPIYRLDGANFVPDYSTLFNDSRSFQFPPLTLNEAGEEITAFDINNERNAILVWTGFAGLNSPRGLGTEFP